MHDLHVHSTRRHDLSDEDWDAFVARTPGGHIMQTTRWGALKATEGWLLERAALVEGDRIVAGGQVLVRPLPWRQSVGYLPKGPLVEWESKIQVRALFAALVEALRPHRSVLIKAEPEVAGSAAFASLLTAYGFHSGHRVQPISTIHLDLRGTEEALLGRMRPKCRYNLGLARRRGVVVRRMTAEDLPAFDEMRRNTERTKHCVIKPRSFFEDAFRFYGRSEQARWLIAEYEGTPLGATLAFAIDGACWFLWGVRADREPQRRAGYALQWGIIQWARARGCTCYDMWGIPESVGADLGVESEEPVRRTDGLWGVYQFKRGFGGRVVRYAGAWDWRTSAVGCKAYELTRRSQLWARWFPPLPGV